MSRSVLKRAALPYRLADVVNEGYTPEGYSVLSRYEGT